MLLNQSSNGKLSITPKNDGKYNFNDFGDVARALEFCGAKNVERYPSAIVCSDVFFDFNNETYTVSGWDALNLSNGKNVELEPCVRGTISALKVS